MRNLVMHELSCPWILGLFDQQGYVGRRCHSELLLLYCSWGEQGGVVSQSEAASQVSGRSRIDREATSPAPDLHQSRFAIYVDGQADGLKSLQIHASLEQPRP
ncbi:hypothetical protein PSEUDO8Z_10478 [Pseudomonas sp. 8Z]|nr:hypothetical protein PSEUDO8Z_10478 [Pseudomonas sp. 8Z]